MKKVLSIILMLVIVLTACSSTGGDKNFVRATITPESLDLALVSTGTTFEVNINNYAGIYTVNTEGGLDLDGAESVEISEDGLTYTVKLKEGLKWVDSTGAEKGEVTAQDYLFTYERIMTPATGAVMSYLFDGIIVGAHEMLSGEGSFEDVGIKALDDYTLEFTLGYQAPYFESMLAFGTFYPQPKGAFDEYGDNYGTNAEYMWYNGPFYTTKWEPEYEVTQSKNELFWDAENVDLDGVTFRNMPELDTAAKAYESGEIDYFVTSDENIYTEGLGGELPKDKLTAYMYYVALNTESEYFAEQDSLREAMYYGFNRANVTSGFSGEVNKPSEVFVPEGISGTTYDGLEYRDFGKDSYVTYDLEKAKAALDKYMSDNGISDPASIVLKFVIADDTAGKKIAESIQSEYKNDLGITIDAEVVPTTQYREMRSNGEYDFLVSSWAPDYADPSTYLDMFKSSNIGSINMPRLNDPEYDEMTANAATVIDPEERMAAYAELEEYIIETQKVIIPFYQKNDPAFTSENYTKYTHLFQLISDRNTEYNE